MTTSNHLTRCGLPSIDLIPFGMHACHFYTDRADLMATLVPYFIAGLKNKERCIWITAPPLPAHEAIEALRAAWDGADDSIQTGALRVQDFDSWYADGNVLSGVEVTQLCLAEEERAIAEGYNGLRITGNVSFVKPGKDWSTYMEYEKAMTEGLKNRRIVTLCSYPAARCDDHLRSEAAHVHQCTLERTGATWQVVTS